MTSNIHCKPRRHSLVGGASAWFHTVRGGMIDPGFEPLQCPLAGTHMPPPSANKAAHSGYETREDVTRSRK